MRKPTAILSLFFVAVIWASTFPIIKLSLQYISSWGFVALRFLTGFFILSIFFARKLKMDRETLFSGAMLGIVLFAGYFFQTLGLQYTSATHSGFIVGLYLVFTPFFAFFVIKEKISVKSGVAVLLSLTGLYFLSNMEKGMNIGDFITLLCAVFYALQIVLVAKYTKMYDPTSLTLVEIGMVAIMGMGGWGLEKFYCQCTPILIFGILFTGILATAVGILLQTHAQKVVPPTHAAVIFTMEPVLAGVFSYLILGETLGSRGIIGAILVLLGMLLVALDKSRS